MKKSSLVPCLSFVAAFLIVAVAAGQVPSTKNAKAGGRHGKFHFMTDEQIAQDNTQRTQICERLVAFRKDIDVLAKDDAAKQRLAAEIQAVEGYVKAVEQRTTHPASPTAGQTEALLNAKKGNMQCTFCHEGSDPSHSVSRGVRH